MPLVDAAYIVKKIGPKTDPCDTPKFIGTVICRKTYNYTNGYSSLMNHIKHLRHCSSPVYRNAGSCLSKKNIVKRICSQCKNKH